jgi:hypothetical protein
MLNLYLIERPADKVDHDEMASLVVAAATPKLARELAKGTRGDQSPEVWAHGKAKLQKIGTAGPRVKQGIVHEHINAG